MTKQLDETDLSMDVREKGITTLDSLNKQSQITREYKMRGHQIRSREELIANWEKPSRFFLNLEKNNYLNKNITELLDDNDEKVTDAGKIL